MGGGGGFRIRLSSQRRLFRTIIISLVFIAVVPPIFFHFQLKRLHQIQGRKCGWMKDPPLVCAHGGDSTNAFPNTMDAYCIALHSKVDCTEINVSRSSNGVLFALHDRYFSDHLHYLLFHLPFYLYSHVFHLGLSRRNKKVYAWTVDDVDSMQKMLFERVDAVVTSNPTLLQSLMQDVRTQCLEDGFSLSQ
ncbi:glycerophosphodiester phosphodiesterase GDPD4-like [Quercus suber]|uniref:glycerophosphodiester phosphodiesterase GDPD4-like n=1 Tax=Quercus suber TaxID=58331 RepID=UPI0032E02F64